MPAYKFVFIEPLDLQPLAQCLYIWGQYINQEKIKLQVSNYTWIFNNYLIIPGFLTII